MFLGVAALAAIGSLSAAIGNELRDRGRVLLGGDVELSVSQRVAEPAELAAMRDMGLLSETLRMQSMAVTADGYRYESPRIAARTRPSCDGFRRCVFCCTLPGLGLSSFFSSLEDPRRGPFTPEKILDRPGSDFSRFVLRIAEHAG